MRALEHECKLDRRTSGVEPVTDSKQESSDDGGDQGGGRQTGSSSPKAVIKTIAKQSRALNLRPSLPLLPIGPLPGRVVHALLSTVRRARTRNPTYAASVGNSATLRARRSALLRLEGRAPSVASWPPGSFCICCPRAVQKT